SAIEEGVRERIRQLRGELERDGLDHGPATIAWHLQRQGLKAPSLSSIRRVLHAANLITPQPRKRPRSSFVRFEAAQPNECWQSDFTHWQLGNGGSVEILSWLDDHSRYLLGCTAHARVTGGDVIATFNACVAESGRPASTLTDNALVYTAPFRGGRSGGPQNLGRPLRWEAVRFPKGVNHEEEASESLAGVQGEGRFGGGARGEDHRGVVARVRGARQPDRRLEAPALGGRLGLVHARRGA